MRNRLSLFSTTLLLAILTAAVSGCQRIAAEKAKALPSDPAQSKSVTSAARGAAYKSATILAQLRDSAVKESSGIVASRSSPGVYWTHNDSGDGPFIYAFDARGEPRGVWRVTNAKARDWEDIAAGPGPETGRSYLYIGDIGNNSGSRTDVTVYRVPEPEVTSSDFSTKSQPRLTEPAEPIRLRYPRATPDAEALLVHPATGKLYIVTKETFGNPKVYMAAPPFNSSLSSSLVRIADLELPSLFGLITGGDISPDGRRVALCDYTQGYELILPENAVDFEVIWKQPLAPIELGKRKQGEAIAYRFDGMAVLATSEGFPTPLIQVVRNTSRREDQAQ